MEEKETDIREKQDAQGFLQSDSQGSRQDSTRGWRGPSPEVPGGGRQTRTLIPVEEVQKGFRLKEGTERGVPETREEKEERKRMERRRGARS